MRKLSEEEMNQVNGGKYGTLCWVGVTAAVVGIGVSMGPVAWGALIGGASGIIGLAASAWGCESDMLAPNTPSDHNKDFGGYIEH